MNAEDWLVGNGAARIFETADRTMKAFDKMGAFAERIASTGAWADRITSAISDPGSFVGGRLGPTWEVGTAWYAPEQETVTRWSARAVLAVLRSEDGVAEFVRERDEARASAKRLAAALSEVLEMWTPHRNPEALARWRAVLAEQPTPADDPLADWERDLLTRQQIASDLDALVGSERLTAAWLERHRLPAFPSPPQVLRAVALDVAACRLHGRRERFDTAIPPGGYVCAEPDPDGPDGICGMPAEDVPCTVHHPDGPRP